jgi:pimeloyl-ACP methyl ester carboxylesterase
MATIVLVHGSHSGGWIWQRVTSLLRAAGHEVYAPTLTGLSDRSHLLECGVNLTTHIMDIVNLLFYEDLSDVVLVGNSYAGMVITGVAAKTPERLSRLIYLDAYVPEDGQSELDLWPAPMREAILADEASAKGLRQPPPAALFGVNDPELVEWVEARWTPQPLDTYTEAVAPGNARSNALARVFIHCTEGQNTSTPLFAPFAAKARTKGWQVRELAAGHLPMVTIPREVSDMLHELSD